MKTFLYKDNSDDRDCVKYIELEFNLQCGHYFSGVHLTGPCFSTSLDYEKPVYDNIKTILTKDEFEQLIQYDRDISELKYGITEGDERYLKGKKLQADIQNIVDKLQSEENKELFEEIIEEEKEYMKDEYNLSDDDIELIFGTYYLMYRDRGIVSYVFKGIEDLAYEEAYALGYATEENDRWFDFEKFGKDLLEEGYLELSDGRIVYLNY